MQNTKLFLILPLCLLLFACSEYQQVLKSPNPEYKTEKAIEYYEEGDYVKALPLLEELVPLYRGTEKGQKIYYYYCYANYYLGYHLTAAFHFRKFYETYPISENAEQALFMSAYCNYLDSPKPSLDQSPTYRALKELQLFVNTFPESELVDSTNTLVDKLHNKLETKAFEKAKQYYKLRYYKSAIVALNNVLDEYPGTSYEEEIRFKILQSYFYLAINSIESKKKERLEAGIESYYEFIDKFAEGEKSEAAELIYQNIIRTKEQLQRKNLVPKYNEL